MAKAIFYFKIKNFKNYKTKKHIIIHLNVLVNVKQSKGQIKLIDRRVYHYPIKLKYNELKSLSF